MVSAATVFPNLSLVHNWPQVNDAGTVTPFISLRQWQPVSSTETEVLSWFAVDASAGGLQAPVYRVPDVLRLVGDVRAGRRRELGLDHLGVEGSLARRLVLNNRMGLASDDEQLTEPLPTSPDRASPRRLRQFNQRNWLTLWSSHLTSGPCAKPRSGVRQGGEVVSTARFPTGARGPRNAMTAPPSEPPSSRTPGRRGPRSAMASICGATSRSSVHLAVAHFLVEGQRCSTPTGGRIGWRCSPTTCAT